MCGPRGEGHSNTDGCHGHHGCGGGELRLRKRHNGRHWGRHWWGDTGRRSTDCLRFLGWDQGDRLLGHDSTKHLDGGLRAGGHDSREGTRLVHGGCAAALWGTIAGGLGWLLGGTI